VGRRGKRCVTQRAAGAGLLPFKAGGGMTRMWGSPVLRRIPDVGSAPNGKRAMEFSVRILGDESVQGRESIRRLSWLSTCRLVFTSSTVDSQMAV